MADISLGLALAGLLFLLGMQRMQAGHAGHPWFAAGLAVAILAPLVLGGGENQLLLLAALGMGLLLALILGLSASMAELAARLALLNGLSGTATALVASLAALEGLLEPGLTLAEVYLAILLGAFSAAGAGITHARLAALLPRVWRHIGQTGAGILLLAASLGLGLLLSCGIVQGAGWLLLYLVLAATSAMSFSLPLAEREAPLAASLFGALSGLGLALLGAALDLSLLLATGILSASLVLLLSLNLARSARLPLWRLLWGTPAHRQEAPAASPAQGLQAEEAARLLREAKEVLLIPGFGCIAAGACEALIELGRKLEEGGARVQLLAHPLAGRLPGQLPLMLREAGAPDAWMSECWPADTLPQGVIFAVGAHDLLNPSLGREGLPDLPAALREGREVILLMKDMRGFKGEANPLLDHPHVHIWQEDAHAALSRLNELLGLA